MNDYEIALPDGRSIVVNAADEGLARQAANNFLMREKGAAKGKQGGLDNFGRAMARGAAMGGADEVAAAADATVGPAVDQFTPSGASQGATWGARYSDNLAAERSQDKAYDDAYPVWSTVGKLAGGVGGALATLPRWLLAAPGMARSVAAGAGLGGVGGFLEGEGGLGNRLTSAATGAGVGGTLGAALPPIAGVVGTAARTVAESPAGRAVADNVIVPGMRVAADALDAISPKVKPASLSAAAPEGGSPLPGDNLLTSGADWLRAGAPTGTRILDEAAERRIADAFQKGGMDAAGLRARLDKLGPGAMIADIDPMATRLGRTAFISPGQAPRIISEALDARNRQTGERIGNSVRESFGDTNPAVLEAERLRGVRSGEGVGNYAEAVGPDAPYTVSPQMREIMQETPAIREVMDRIEQDAVRLGRQLTPAQVAHRVKQQLQKDADAAFSSGRAINKDDVRDLGERWRTALHEANPAIWAADEAWQAGSQAIDALELGRQFMRQGTGEVADAVSPAVLADRIPRMSAEEAQAFLAGAADTLYGKTNSGMRPARQVAAAIDENQNLRSKLVSMLGQDNANRLFNRAMAERTFAQTDRAIRGGSDTASKLLSAMDDAAAVELPTSAHSMVARVLGKAADAYNRGKAGNEAVRARIAGMLTEGDAAANKETIDRIVEMIAQQQRRARGVQRGTAAIGGQAQE